MYCKKCGSMIAEGARACPNCGYVVVATPTQKQPSNSAAKGSRSHNDVVTDAVTGVFSGVANQINSLTGNEDQVELRFGNFFDSVFAHHSHEEMAEVFICGTPRTTPDIRVASKEWPHPWLYSRVLLLLLAVYAGGLLMIDQWGNAKILPTIMFVGSLAVPFSLVIFFFETNVLRNISFARVVEMFMVGGIASLIATLFVSQFFPETGQVGEVGAGLIPGLITGVVEELGKIFIIAFFMSRTKGKNYVLSALLIGATVGAGFAVFESAGYAFENMLDKWGDSGSIRVGYEFMLLVISTRAVLALGGHVVWAAVEGAALAICEGDGGFKLRMLGDIRFLAIAILCMLLHAIWDTTIPFLDQMAIPLFLTPKFVLLIVLIWIVVMVMLHRGLAQLNSMRGQR